MDYRFHFVFKVPRGGGNSAVLEQPERCKLLKVFEGGKPVTAIDNPIAASEEAFVGAAGDTAWIRQGLLLAIRSP